MRLSFFAVLTGLAALIVVNALPGEHSPDLEKQYGRTSTLCNSASAIVKSTPPFAAYSASRYYRANKPRMPVGLTGPTQVHGVVYLFHAATYPLKLLQS